MNTADQQLESTTLYWLPESTALDTCGLDRNHLSVGCLIVNNTVWLFDSESQVKRMNAQKETEKKQALKRSTSASDACAVLKVRVTVL